MSLVTPWPSVRQAFIRQLRSNLVLEAGLPGDWSEGFAPPKTAYPLGVVALHYAPSFPDTTGRTIYLGVDVFIFAKDQAGAASLYQLAFDSLNNTLLALTGQTSLQCRETSSISLQDVDTEGKAVYQVGGVYEVRVSQGNPALRTIVITADSTIA
jgi:hypothetical protein